MKYEAPFGVSDPNASYINGNPSTGTMGSIPPAASIENPQREIVNLITDAGGSPTDADLHQLGKGVQSGILNVASDLGTPNQIAISPVPPVASYWLGQYWRIKVANVNTGAVHLSVNGLVSVPIVHSLDLSNLNPWELNVGQIIEVAHDGAGHFQLLTGSSSGSQILMTAPRDVYVNVATGSDTAYDGSQATVSGIHGPFQTIQKALSIMTLYNLGGWSFNIHVANGVYSITQLMRMPQPNGSGVVALYGNHANPQNVQIYNTNQGSCFFFQSGGTWIVDGFSFRATAAAVGDQGNGIWIAGGSNVNLSAVAFGPVAAYHLICQDGSTCYNNGPVTIWGAPGAGHVACFSNAIYTNVQVPPGPPPLTITTSINCPQAFANAAGGGYLQAMYGTITGAGNVSGVRYLASGNGVVNVGGRGTSYLPGTLAGTLGSGGQLI